MDVIDTIAVLRERLAFLRQGGKSIALVPTMGFLHDGHLALIDAARLRADVVVVSLFVNPLQFGPGEDFERYPRDAERDRALAGGRGTDILFVPTREEMYRDGASVRVAAGPAGALWEGAVRPGHFDGVLTVVAKLFNIVQPSIACFGQKDIQQVTLVRQMVRDLNFPLVVVVVPTLRAEDGLALSSRNVYLGAAERAEATVLFRALHAAATKWREGTTDARTLMQAIHEVLRPVAAVHADYIAIVDPASLTPVEQVRAGDIAAVAARVGHTRLIDNVIFAETD